MALIREEQPFAEPSRKIRLELRDTRFVRWRMRRRPRREAVDLTDVARRRNDQGAPTRHAGNARVPPVDRALTKFDHALRRALALTKGGKHPAGKPRRIAAELGRPL